MKTDDLINMLASGPDVRASTLPTQRIVLTIACGLLVSIALMMSILGVRPDLADVAMLPSFWLKISFVAALAWAGRMASMRLSSPGARINMLPAWIATPLLVIWLAAAFVLMSAAPEDRAQLFWGSTWRTCPFLIATLSLPIFAAILIAMRNMAPTRLRLAGAAAGFAAGAAAATIYSMHCPEMEASFIGFWYLLGILIPTGIGALLGPRILRW